MPKFEPTEAGINVAQLSPSRHPNRPPPRWRVIEIARGPESETFERSMDVQISRVRRLVEPDPSRPRHIQTVWGVGYVFVPDPADAAAVLGGPPPFALPEIPIAVDGSGQIHVVLEG